MERHYVYKSTQDKLNDHIAHIEESGDQIIPPLYWTGGRDWLILCRAAPKDGPPGSSVATQRQAFSPYVDPQR